MECSLELLERGLLVALQDLGAAGLTSAASEMAAKGDVGVDIDVARVPLREPGMEPFEIMVSRVPGADALRRRARDTSPPCSPSASTGRPARRRSARSPTPRRVRILDGERLVGEMPVAALVDECPIYDARPAAARRPALPRTAARAALRGPGAEALLALLASPTSPTAARSSSSTTASCSRAPCAAPGRPTPPCSRCPAARRGSGDRVAIDCNGRRVAADPYRGTIEAVLECAANLACVGALPLGLTNCLNFGNPEKPHIAWQLTESVRGLGDACRALEIPVVGGNVLALQRGRRGARSTRRRSSGWSGSCPTSRRAGRLGFRAEGDRIAIVGWPSRPTLRGSELARLGGAELPTALPECDVAGRDRRAGRGRRAPFAPACSSSAHDIAEGGLATALAECCLAGGLGAEVVARRHRQAAARALRRGARRLRRQRRRAGAARARRARDRAGARHRRRQSPDDRARRRGDSLGGCARPRARRLFSGRLARGSPSAPAGRLLRRLVAVRSAAPQPC